MADTRQKGFAWPAFWIALALVAITAVQNLADYELAKLAHDSCEEAS